MASEYGFRLDSSTVRLDYFKPSGKWYETLELNMEGLYDFGLGPHDAIKEACRVQLGSDWLERKIANGWHVIVLEPYHKYSFPVMLRGRNVE